MNYKNKKHFKSLSHIKTMVVFLHKNKAKFLALIIMLIIVVFRLKNEIKTSIILNWFIFEMFLKNQYCKHCIFDKFNGNIIRVGVALIYLIDNEVFWYLIRNYIYWGESFSCAAILMFLEGIINYIN